MKAQILKVDGTQGSIKPNNGTDFSLEEMKEIVGGWIEVVYFHDGTNRIMVLNEEGKLEGLPYNHQATIIAQQGRAIGLNDEIVGNVLLCHRNQVK